MANYFEEYAQRIHALGYSVIPILGGKSPGFPNWSHYSYHSQSEDDVEKLRLMVENEESVGISIVLGKGIWALDIDTEDKRITEVPDALHSAMRKRGAKGLTLFYRTPHNGAIGTLHPATHPFDLMGSGSHTVIPPSPHPDGHAYAWLGQGLIPADELPVLEPALGFELLTNLCIKFGVAKTISTAIAQRSRSTDGDGDANLPVFGKGGRNNLLVRAAYSMACNQLIAGKTDEECIDRLLFLDRKWHGADAWFEDAGELAQAKCRTPRELATWFYGRALKSGAKREDILPDIKIELVENEEPVSVEEQIDPRDISHIVKLMEGHIEQPTKDGYEELLAETALGEDFTMYLLERGGKISMPFTLASSLCLGATIACNMFKTKDCWPNIYTLMIGNSGVGKDGPQSAVEVFLGSAGVEGLKFKRYGDYASAHAVFGDFHKQKKRTGLDIVDEVSGLFSAMGPNSGNQQMTSAGENFNKLFSASNKLLPRQGRKTKDDVVVQVANPCLVLLGATTIRGGTKFINSENMEMGFFPRILMFSEERANVTRKPRARHRVEVPMRSIALIKDIVHTAMELEPPEPGQAQPVYQEEDPHQYLMRTAPTEIPFEPGVEDELDRRTERCEELIDKVGKTVGGRIGESYYSVILTRHYELVSKLLVIWYVSQARTGPHLERPRVSMRALEWAERIVRYCHYSAIEFVETFAENNADLASAVVARAQALALRPNSHIKLTADRLYIEGLTPVNLKQIVGAAMKQSSGIEPNMQLVNQLCGHLKESGLVTPMPRKPNGTARYRVKIHR